MKDVKRIKRIIALLKKAWLTQPDQRLGQLLVNAFGQDILYYVNDDLIEEALKEWVRGH